MGYVGPWPPTAPPCHQPAPQTLHHTHHIISTAQDRTGTQHGRGRAELADTAKAGTGMDNGGVGGCTW